MCYERLRADGFSFGNRTQISRVAGWCKPNHQPIGGSDPNHQGIWNPGRCVFITAVPIAKLFARGGGDMCYERLRAEAGVN